MTFQGMPLWAKVYLVAICLGGIAACGAVPYLPSSSNVQGIFEVLAFFGLAAIAGGRKVNIFGRAKASEAVSMSLGFAVTFAGMLHFGAGMAVALGVVSCFAGCLFPKRQPSYQLAFNVSLMAIESLLGSLVYLALNHGSLEMRREDTFFAVLVSTLTYYAVNTGGVSIIIGLCSKKSPFKVWRETFIWTAPSFLAGACLSAVAILAFGHNVATFILFLAPVGYFLHQSYTVQASHVEEKLKHMEEVQQKQTQLADLYLSTIKSLALAVDAKDQYTHQHILRVQRYAVAIAVEMGFTGDDLEAVNTGALLHDIGKLGVPEHVLVKPGRLTEEEFNQIKKHPEIGAAILDPVEFPWPVIPIVKYHHEKWDGTGYPEGLKGEEIPLSARIMAVADVYDALTSSRSYRSAWSHEKAYEVICKDVGTHFDAQVVEAFKVVIERVIQEMATVGEGPLAPKTSPAQAVTSSAKAFHDISRSTAELWALYEIAPTLAAGLGLHETVNLLARKLESIFYGSSCLFLLRGSEDDQLHCHASVGPNQEFFSGSSTVNVNSRSWSVAREGTPYLGEFDREDLLLSASPSAQWTVMKSAVIVPIWAGDEVLGTVNLYHAEEEAFSTHDVERVELIASQAASVILSGMKQAQVPSSNSDSLTGLPRIDYISSRLDALCSSAETTSFALLCVDMESFKAISDHFGSSVGDRILAQVAECVRSAVGVQGVAARYRCDDFLIVLDGADAREATAFADRIGSAISSLDTGLIDLQLGEILLRSNAGIACFPEDGRSCAKLLTAVDRDLRAVKIRRKLAALRVEKKSAARAIKRVS